MKVLYFIGLRLGFGLSVTGLHEAPVEPSSFVPQAAIGHVASMSRGQNMSEWSNTLIKFDVDWCDVLQTGTSRSRHHALRLRRTVSSKPTRVGGTLSVQVLPRAGHKGSYAMRFCSRTSTIPSPTRVFRYQTRIYLIAENAVHSLQQANSISSNNDARGPADALSLYGRGLWSVW